MSVRVGSVLRVVRGHGHRGSRGRASPHDGVWPSNAGRLKYLCRISLVWGRFEDPGIPTKRCVLKRESNNILDSLDWHGQRITRKTLTQNNLYPSKVISWTPEALVKDLLSEVWKLQQFEISSLGKL